MATLKHWKEQYNSVIKTHHEYNAKGHSLRIFLSLEDIHKDNLLSYYKKPSLLESIKDDELSKVDLHVIPCPDAELCNFLQS
jgi:hypothetical protein